LNNLNVTYIYYYLSQQSFKILNLSLMSPSLAKKKKKLNNLNVTYLPFSFFLFSPQNYNCECEMNFPIDRFPPSVVETTTKASRTRQPTTSTTAVATTTTTTPAMTTLGRKIEAWSERSVNSEDPFNDDLDGRDLAEILREYFVERAYELGFACFFGIVATVEAVVIWCLWKKSRKNERMLEAAAIVYSRLCKVMSSVNPFLSFFKSLRVQGEKLLFQCYKLMFPFYISVICAIVSRLLIFSPLNIFSDISRRCPPTFL